MPIQLSLDGVASEIDIAARQPELICTVDGVAYSVSEALALADDCVMLRVDGRSYQVWRALEGDRIHLKIGTRMFSVGYEEAIAAAAHAGHAGNEIHADMPGVVVDVRAVAGATVAPGDPLLTIESMKMQITVHAPRAGRLDAVHVAQNQSFQKGALLVSMHAETE